MHKLLYFFILLLLFISCQEKKKPKPVIEAKRENIQDTTSFSFDGFAVYELSENTIAITYELSNNGEENSTLNTIFNKVSQTDSIQTFETKLKNAVYIDTISHFKILKNNTLETEVKKVISPNYYIYGTKGYQKVKINEVLFSVDECISNILAFPIKDYDIEKYGHPLICSKIPLKIVYGKNYTLQQQKINKYLSNQENDYSNKTITTKIFANIDSNYLTYEDDFIWGIHPFKSVNDFPSRAIYNINNKDKVTAIWAKSLDLFGIPCD